MWKILDMIFKERFQTSQALQKVNLYDVNKFHNCFHLGPQFTLGKIWLKNLFILTNYTIKYVKGIAPK